MGSHGFLMSGESSTSSALIGQGRDITTLSYAGSGSAIAPANSSAHLTRNVHLAGFTLSASASTGIGIDEINAYKWLVEDFRVSGFSGSGGVCIRIRGEGIAGPYFDRHYNGFTDNCETHVLINYDSAANVPTSYEFFDVHPNVGAVGFDIKGQSGWFHDCYVQNMSSYGAHYQSNAKNNIMDGMRFDNSGTPGVGTSFQIESGASGNVSLVTAGNFSVNQPVDNGANNHTYWDPARFHLVPDGTPYFTGTTDAEWHGTIRSGLTTNQNAGWCYESYNGTAYVCSGISDTNSYVIRLNSMHGTTIAEATSSGLNISPDILLGGTGSTGNGGVARANSAFLNSPTISGLLISNNQSALDTTDTSPTIYSSNTSGGAYPFTTAGNLIIQSRPSGANRDILFVTGGTPAIAAIIGGGNNVPAGIVKAGGLFSSGTQSISGCSLSSAAGGLTAGSFASGTTGACTVTITLPTAPNGWACDAHDLTAATTINQTAASANSATISGTTTSGDVITWKCQGY